ncbi:hypothetical protein [Corynebacterium cystitidis]|uniref:hypothetical protein n=1 Tax=Corynebacterium cystitidis TaxID=35757 RepID=UPI00211F31AD|nr:hypothetical protein [Corynebacterium cystitidis]
MSFLTQSRGLRHLFWSNAVAHAQRKPPVETDRPISVAVAALSKRILTSPVSATIGMVVNAVAEQPVALVDGDGVNRPLHSMLGSRGESDLVGLVQSPTESLRREHIERFVDSTGAVPLLTTWSGSPGTILPEVLDAAVTRLSHRWPAVVIDLPFTCPSETLSAGTALAKHVVLVTDKHHEGHEWLYRDGHQLSEAAQNKRVTVVMYGATADTELPPDTCALPVVNMNTQAREKITLPIDPESLSLYHKLLSHLYPAE